MKCKQTINLSNKSPIDLAYLAGFIDGEGTLTICPNTSKKSRNKPTKSYRCIFQIVNTDKKIIDWIANFLGYSFITRRDPRDDGHKNNKIRYILTLSSIQNVSEIAKAVLPYLKIKQQQAMLIIEYADNHKTRIITNREISIVAELKILNKRGVNNGSL